MTPRSRLETGLVSFLQASEPGHTRDTHGTRGAHGHTEHTDKPHNHPNPTITGTGAGKKTLGGGSRDTHGGHKDDRYRVLHMYSSLP